MLYVFRTLLALLVITAALQLASAWARNDTFDIILGSITVLSGLLATLLAPHPRR